MGDAIISVASKSPKWPVGDLSHGGSWGWPGHPPGLVRALWASDSSAASLLSDLPVPQVKSL